METQKEKINPTKIPQHIAVIMDGNGRWAEEKGNNRIFGHRSAIKAVRDTVEGAAELGVKFLTLYAFSTENWQRPRTEIKALMELLIQSIRKEVPTLMENKIRLRAIGDLEELPRRAKRELEEAIQTTAENETMTCTLALSYGGRWDLVNAIKRLGKKIESGHMTSEQITEENLKAHLSTNFMPDPELMVRTSGEFRISNFLLWELAYSEIHITQKYWPDFRKEDLHRAIVDFQGRKRRFGKVK